MVGWYHRFDEHEFEQAPGVGDGQGNPGILQSMGSQSQTWLSNWTDPTGFTENCLCGEKTSQIWCHKWCECGSYFWNFVSGTSFLGSVLDLQNYCQDTRVTIYPLCVCVCVHARAFARLSPALCDLMDSLLGSSVHGILRVRLLEWVAISPTQGSRQILCL